VASTRPDELVERDDQFLGERIVRLTLNYAQKRNALSAAMLHALAEAVHTVPRPVSVIIVRARGPVFSSGHDLNEILHGTDAEVTDVFNHCEDAMAAIRNARQVVIAEVNGLATAAGCQLVATCDLAVAAATAQFATPGVRIGYFCVSPGVPLSRNVGQKMAAAMLFTGAPITAAEAMARGLVNQVVPGEELADAALALARQVAQFSGDVLARGKQHFYRQLAMPEFEALAYASRVMVDQRHRPDAVEGITAFLEKRPPVWTN